MQFGYSFKEDKSQLSEYTSWLLPVLAFNCGLLLLVIFNIVSTNHPSLMIKIKEKCLDTRKSEVIFSFKLVIHFLHRYAKKADELEIKQNELELRKNSEIVAKDEVISLCKKDIVKKGMYTFYASP